MRITIINEDGAVGVNEEFYFDLDLSECELPESFWALQWNERGGDRGHIEYNSPDIQNDLITELPTWAMSCVNVWQAKKDEALAAIEAEKLHVSENLRLLALAEANQLAAEAEAARIAAEQAQQEGVGVL